MQQILAAIKILQREKPAVFMGGEVGRMILESNTPTLSLNEISQWEEEHHFALPKSYKEFIAAYNGLSFYEDGGMRIFDFYDAVDTSELQGVLSSKMMVVGYSNNCDDYIYLDCSHEEGEMFYSLEGLGSLEKMQICFETFLNTLISCGGFYFWRSHQLDHTTW